MAQKSSRSETFIVQPFEARGNRWRLAEARRLDSEIQARRLAEELAPRFMGVTLSVVEVAADVDYCGEPRLLETFGEVPL